MNKELIQKRFERKLNQYNKHAKIQKTMSEKLVSLNSDIWDKEYNAVLEIGCGTGLFTKNVLKRLNFKKYECIDIVPECKDYIEKISNQVEFYPCDAEEYIKKCDNFDLIISNASLQWIENLPEFIEQMYTKLNNQGAILFSVFGKENFKEINKVTGVSLDYYSKNEWEKVLKKYDYKIDEEIIELTFTAPKDVLKHIQNTGVNAISTETWTKKDLINFEKSYNVLCKNKPILTYNPVYIKIIK